MLRILRYGLLGLAFAAPFAMPQASQAAAPAPAANVIRCRPVVVRPAFYRGHYFRVWHGRVHYRR